MGGPSLPSEVTESMNGSSQGIEPASVLQQLLDAQKELLDAFDGQHQQLRQALLDQQQTLQACIASGASVNSATEKADLTPQETPPPMEPTESENEGRPVTPYRERLNRQYSATLKPSASRLFNKSSVSLGVQQQCPCARVAASEHFNHIAGAFILLNVLFVCVQADFLAQNPGQSQPVQLIVIETGFFFVFLVELMIRIIAFRRDFWCGEEWRWNIFDATIVVVAAFEETLKLFSGKSSDSNFTSFRLLRILKITRIIRIVRVIRMFRELRIMFMSIIFTIRTLCWSIICVLLIMSVVAAYLATAVSEFIAEEGEDPEATKYFGSMLRAMISLFQATTGGVDWRILSEILARASLVAEAMLYMYISVMAYAVMNILTGICVTTANKAAEDDLEYTIHQELTKRNSVITNLKRILTGDSNNTYITWPQLRDHLTDAGVRGYFRRLDLEPWHLHSLFDMLTHESGRSSICIDHFIRGCVRLRCQVKNIDMIAAIQDLERNNQREFKEVHKVLVKVGDLLDPRSPSRITSRSPSRAPSRAPSKITALGEQPLDEPL